MNNIKEMIIEVGPVLFVVAKFSIIIILYLNYTVVTFCI